MFSDFMLEKFGVFVLGLILIILAAGIRWLNNRKKDNDTNEKFSH